MSAPTHVDSSGKIVASGLPDFSKGFVSNTNGGLIESGAAKTAASIQKQSDQALKAGVTMKGGGLTQFQQGSVVEGKTIPGVSATGNTQKLLEMNSALKANAVYDSLGNATPSKVGGRKHKRKTNGKRITRRNSKRNRRKHSRRIRRGNGTKKRKH